MIQNSNSVRVDKTEIENKKSRINSKAGVSEKASYVTDNSTISGWKNLAVYSFESDEIRSSLSEAEELNLRNIEAFKTIIGNLDQTLADNM